ncbi:MULTISPECIES: hypothetical protein [Niastella]|uniref:Uncharacterized protein n=1 Tax=Niastella soli TaxID=2821487 RepID=A0ABS3YXP6_9BACT|nr:hypothetical protein [Niastella soli]MBO9202528.1 hypothetical protein [Niastella soli]
MIASKIGKTFLTAYNTKYKKSYSARDFFERIYFPLFYDHEKYMQWISNSPYDQISKQKLTGDKKKRHEANKKLITAIEKQEIGMSTSVGFPSSDVMATTSGMVSNIKLPLHSENIYLSWIGGGCGIGVQGGLSLYIDNAEVLMLVFEGWKLYRKEYLNKLKKLRGNQMDTWNGQWLAHAMDTNFNPKKPLAEFNPIETDKAGNMQLSTQNWLKVIFGLTNKIKNHIVTGYIFSLGNTNFTVGFIPFNLPQIKHPIELYKIIFGENEYLKNAKQIEGLFGSEHSFLKCCEMGAIGIKALEPKGLKGYIFLQNGEMKMPDYKKQTQIVTYNTYITWILSMLNATETLWEKAGAYAQILLTYEQSAKKGSTKKGNEVSFILKSSYPKQFIDALTVLLEDNNIDLKAINKIAEEADRMPKENFPYFLSLIRFKYAYHKNLLKTSKL